MQAPFLTPAVPGERPRQSPRVIFRVITCFICSSAFQRDVTVKINEDVAWPPGREHITVGSSGLLFLIEFSSIDCCDSLKSIQYAWFPAVGFTLFRHSRCQARNDSTVPARVTQTRAHLIVSIRKSVVTTKYLSMADSFLYLHPSS